MQAISNIAKPNNRPTQNPTGNLGVPPAQMALNNAQSGVRPANPFPLFPPTGQRIKSHTINHPDGTSVIQTYHNPDEQKDGLVNPKQTGQKAPTAPTPPSIKVVNGKHQIPFHMGGGKFGFIDGQGNVTS